jgi:hypothetical protein
VSGRVSIRVAVAAVAAACATLAPEAGARAQVMLGAEPMPPSPVVRVSARPRFTVAIGGGASLDSAGFMPEETHAIPSFHAAGGIGENFTGFELAAIASQATGRYRAPNSPLDRLALDGMVVVRFLAQRVSAEDYRYRSRVGRTAAFELGLAVERAGRGPVAATRFGMHTGARIEFPLVPFGASANEPRLRVGVRRMLGASAPMVGDTTVHDSTELYTALALSF